MSNQINQIHWLKPYRVKRSIKLAHAFLQGNGGNALCSKVTATDTEIITAPTDYDASMACKLCLLASERLYKEFNAEPASFGEWLAKKFDGLVANEIESHIATYEYWQATFGNHTAREMYFGIYSVEVPDKYDVKEGVQ